VCVCVCVERCLGGGCLHAAHLVVFLSRGGRGHWSGGQGGARASWEGRQGREAVFVLCALRTVHCSHRPCVLMLASSASVATWLFLLRVGGGGFDCGQGPLAKHGNARVL
jgi:hypothetical protein